MERWIMHVDMEAFYAAVIRLTQALDSLKNKHGEKIIGRGIFAAKGNYGEK
ncbi:MAG: hypothetical protein KGZ96_04570 [Clostridia bacterium]|nr:hypothetical protein [Clostridia bacterium]